MTTHTKSNMKETKEKSSLTDYHRERNKKAVLAVEEMKNRPYSLKEMKEQTTRILSTVSPEERGIVFELGDEIGGIRIFRKRRRTGYFFIYQHDEDELRKQVLSVNYQTRYGSFESAFQFINNTFRLYNSLLLTIHADYKEYVLNELIIKLNQDDILNLEFKYRSNYQEILNTEFKYNENQRTWKTRIMK